MHVCVFNFENKFLLRFVVALVKSWYQYNKHIVVGREQLIVEFILSVIIAFLFAHR